MSGCLNSSSYKLSNKNNIVNENHNSLLSLNPLEKKGIVSILSSELPNTNINSKSIRRTLSADMSSPKWLENNNGVSLKKVQSSEKFQSLGEEELNDKKDCSGGAAFEDIWSSILSQKKPDEAVPAPYVHPLVKRASSLSEKSLEICTESLGSETGSDGILFPFDQRDESGPQPEVEVEGDEVVEEMKSDFVEVGRCSYPVNKKKVNSGMVTRSFPPPLPSLANRDDGSNLQMRTRRQDGRLVLEAVSVPSRNCFKACREDGRLLLTLKSDNEVQEIDEFDEHDIEVAIDEVIEDVEKKLTLVVEEMTCLPTTRMINVDKASSAMIMSKIMELTNNRNMSTWPRTSNRAVITSLDEGDENALENQFEVQPVAAAGQKVVQSLPPRPKVSTTTSAADMLNTYEYYWRRSDNPSAAAVAVLKPLAGKQNNAIGGTVSPQVVKDTNRINKFLLRHNIKGVPQEEMVLVKAATVGGEYLVPIFKGCKEPRRSLYFLEPFCIATS